MNKIYCDICKEEINPGDPHHVARFACNKRWWNAENRTIDICNACHNVLTDRKRAMEEATDCIWTEPLESEDDNGLGE